MADNRPKKILVAEDTDSNFLLVSIILRKEYTVLRAYNGIEAIDVYKKEQPDLILMDIKMPEMDGLEASRAIRDIDPEIPIIALTANAFDSDKQKAIDAGCNDYMAKPIVVGQLTAMIKKNTSKPIFRRHRAGLRSGPLCFFPTRPNPIPFFPQIAETADHVHVHKKEIIRHEQVLVADRPGRQVISSEGGGVKRQLQRQERNVQRRSAKAPAPH